MRKFIENEISIEDIKAIYTSTNKAHGKQQAHFFDKDTLRFFNGRLAGIGYQTERYILFVTSEQHGNDARRYTIRAFDKVNCSMDTIGEFQQFKTGAQAKAALFELLAGAYKGI